MAAEAPYGQGDGDVGDVSAYERLAALAEAELTACEAERPEELAALYAEAEALVATLPATPPAAAAPALRRAAIAQELIGELLGARLATRDSDLDHLRRGRAAARSYAATADAAARG
jgi:hypothetical protein